MNIEKNDLTIAELFEGYEDRGDEGVVAYGGILDVRPPYQREFVYKEKQRDDVIRSVLRGFPLNVMYWVDKGDGNFEVLDGQQRSLSICQYLNGASPWMAGIFTPNQWIRKNASTNTVCQSTSARARIARRWTGSGSSTLPAWNSRSRNCAILSIPAPGCQKPSGISVVRAGCCATG